MKNYCAQVCGSSSIVDEKVPIVLRTLGGKNLSLYFSVLLGNVLLVLLLLLLLLVLLVECWYFLDIRENVSFAFFFSRALLSFRPCMRVKKLVLYDGPPTRFV